MAQGKRLIFMGTSAFAEVILDRLLESGANIAAVYTQPDRPAGRGMQLRESAVKIRAKNAGLPILQPVNFKNDADLDAIAALAPDFLIVAAYGLILPQAALDIPAIAPINAHASLLPKYRGAAPIQRAIMENWQPEATTGVSIMRMEAGLDCGPVYASASLPLSGETGASLTPKLASLAADLLIRNLDAIAAGALTPQPQNNAEATYAHKLQKEDGLIDWRRPSACVDAQIRAVTPWPGAKTTLKLGQKEIAVTLLPGKIGGAADAPAGSVKTGKQGLGIACADCWYAINALIPQGRKEMSAQAFVNGLRLPAGVAGSA